MGEAHQAGADSATVRLRPNGPNLDPIVVEFGVAAQELRAVVDGVNDDVNVAVVVEIAEGRAARRSRLGDARPRLQGNVGETAVVQILVQQFALGVSGFTFDLLDFGIDVAVADQNVGPAVVLHVEKTAAPAQKLGVRAQTRREGDVFETGPALVVIERRRVAGKVGFDDVKIAVEVIVGGGNAHAGLRLAIGAEGATSFDGDILELAVLFVLIERAGSRIVGHVNVGPAVVVEIGGEHAQAEGAFRAKNPGSLGNVGERAVAVVVVEDVLPTLETRRSTRDHRALVQAWARFRHGSRCQIEVNIVGDEKIQAAVAVIVNKGAAGVPSRALARHAGLFADVGERAVAVVVIEDVLAEVGNEQVIPAVVVVVADANALPPAGVAQASFRRHVGECAVTIVAKQMRSGFTAGGKTFQARPVHQKDVEPSVVVVIVEGYAASGGFEQVLVLVLSAEDGLHVQPGFAGNVDEADCQIGFLCGFFFGGGFLLRARARQ